MALKDLYRNYAQFGAEAEVCENGIINMMLHDWFYHVLIKKMSDGKQPSPYRDRYFMDYPYIRGYDAMAVSYSLRDKHDAYMEWYRKHAATITETTELPLYTKNYTFSDYLDHRMSMFLQTSIHARIYKQYGNCPVLVLQDRQSCLVFPTVDDILNIHFIKDKMDRVIIIGNVLTDLGTYPDNIKVVVTNRKDGSKITGYHIGELFTACSGLYNPDPELRSVESVDDIVKRIKIQHEQYGSTTFYPFPWREY